MVCGLGCGGCGACGVLGRGRGQRSEVLCRALASFYSGGVRRDWTKKQQSQHSDSKTEDKEQQEAENKAARSREWSDEGDQGNGVMKEIKRME